MAAKLMPDPDPRALHAQFTAACDRWRLGNVDRAALLGVSGVALDRWRAGDALDDAGALPPSPADRAALAVELDAGLRFVPGAEPDVAAFLRRPGTAPDGVATALGVMLARPAGPAAVRAHMVTLGLPRMLDTPPDGPGGWGALTDDPIVLEVRAIREALLAEAGYDLAELSRQTRAHGAAREFGAFARLLPEGADLRHIADPEHDRLPADELRAWAGEADARGEGDGSAQ